MKKKLNILLSALAAAFVPMLFSCSNLFDSDDKDSSSSVNEGTAYITLGTPSYRTVIPSVSDSDFNVFTLTGAKTGEDESELGKWYSVSSMLEASVEVSPGTWNFTLTADAGSSYNGSSTSTYTGTIKNKEIAAGSNSLEFTLSLSDRGTGEGSLKITFDYSSAENADKVSSAEGKLTNIDDGSTVYLSGGTSDGCYYLQIDKDNNTATFSLSNIPSGSYRAEITFYRCVSESGGSGSSEDFEIATYRELVQISSGLVSTASRTIESFDEVYSISYNLNGGSLEYGTTAQESFTRKTDVIPLPLLTRDYYTFAGWYTDESCSDESAVPVISAATDENSYTTYGWSAGTYTQNLTLYAKWTPVTFKITYVLNDKNASFDDERVLHTDEDGYYSLFTVETETFDIPIPKTTTDDKGFSYWSLNSDSRWSSYYKIAQIKKEENTEDLTLYAYWGPAKYNITYILNKDDASLAEDAVTTYTSETSTFALPTPTTDDTSTMFYAWYTTKTFDKDTSVSQIEEGSKGDITLYARWVTGVQASSIPEMIKAMTASGTIRGIGSCSTSTISEINKALKELASTEGRSEVLVTLDLTDVTDLTELNAASSSSSSVSFYECTNLAGIMLPDTVTSIGASAFYGCSNLKSVYITDMEAWCGITFEDEYANPLSNGATLYLNKEVVKSIEIPSSIQAIKNYTFYSYTSLESVSIPDNVASIGAGAFSGCTSLASITLPANLETIKSNAFYGCTSISSVTIPNTVTSIGASAFYGCSNLKSVYITDMESWCGITFEDGDANPLSNGATLYLNNKVVKSVEIPSSFSAIKDYIFYSYTSLESVSMPDGATSIGAGSFYGCTSISSMTIPNTVTSIGESAFYGCANLKSVYITDMEAWCGITFKDKYANPLNNGATLYLNNKIVQTVKIPSTITAIKDYTFYGCTSLESVSIPDGATSIGAGAFSGCASISSMTIPNTVTSIGYGAFSGCSSLEEITVPFVGGSINPRENSENELFGYIFGSSKYDGGTAVTSYYGNYSDKTYYIPTKLKKVTVAGGDILYGAFYGCTNLTSITLLDSVKSIGLRAFSGCSSLESLVIGKGVTSIKVKDGTDNMAGDYKGFFSGCSSLESITISDENTVYDSRGNCNAIIETSSNSLISGCKSTVIPSSVTSIGAYAFRGCTGFTSMVVPDTIKSIGESAFSGCSSLEELTIPFVGSSADATTASESTWLGYIFGTSWYGGGTLANYLLGGYNYYIPTSLKKVTVTGGNILSGAFSDCTTLTTITLLGSGSITSIGERAFEYCKSLESIAIPNTVTSIGKSAFSNCSSLEEITVPFVGGSADATEASESTLFGYIFGTKSGSGDKVTQYYTSSFYDEFYIPSTLKKVTVTGGNILYGAFCGCSNLTSITIPSGVTSIGEKAFYACSNLTSITIPSGVTSIGEKAFYACWNLTSIAIPESTTVIGSEAFRNCDHLESVNLELSDNLASIGASAFYNCTSLASIAIPDSVISIGENAFFGCTSLKTAKIGKGVKNILGAIFNGCSSLEELTVPFVGSAAGSTEASRSTLFGYIFGSSEYEGGTAVTSYYSDDGSETYYIPTSLNKVTVTGGNILYGAFYACSNLTSITIPDSLTSIGEKAFYSCTNLAGMTLPDNVASIGASAFSECTSLAGMTIPDSVISIGQWAFLDCSKLTSVYITDMEAWCNIAFEDGDANPLSNGAALYLNKTIVQALEIPNSITAIKDYTFYGCTSLESVSMPDNVASIGASAFYGCTSLESVSMPDNVASIGASAFYRCTSLASVTLPDNLKTIGGLAFAYSYSLTSITIPDNVASIGASAFDSCTSLESVTMPASVTSIGGSAFVICSKLTSVYITDMEAWCSIAFETSTANPLSNGATLYLNNEVVKSVEIPSSITAIKDYTFYGYTSLESVSMLGNVTSIGQMAFDGCTKLSSIALPDSLETIGGLAFCRCLSLTSITIPGKVTSIGESAFKDCTSLKDITLSSSLTSLSTSLFYGCTSLASISLPDGVASIGASAFAGCTSLASITIPASVTSIGASAFRDCSKLKSVYITDMEAWCNIDFKSSTVGLCYANPLNNWAALYLNKKIVQTLEIPSSITAIKDYTFYGCSSLEKFTIPKNLEKIGLAAFSNSSLTTADFSQTIGDWYYTYSKNDYKNGTKIDSSVLKKDTAAASKYLTTTYGGYCWYLSSE